MEAHTAYVEGIPYSVDEDGLRDFILEGCGNGEDSILNVRMPRWHDSNKPRGYAHVDFQSEEDLELALKLDGKTLGGRYLKISKANARGSKKTNTVAKEKQEIPEGCKTLFVKNLPYDTDEDSVEEAFARFGKIINVRLSRWNHTGKLKGFGYVEFETEESLQTVLRNEEDIYVGDRAVYCDFDAPNSGPKAVSEIHQDANGADLREGI
eukprot:CAMPEP_0204832598 /NCGR_PEP_ID=MMETSP1346-20131115/14284_1 /ASSEMBLY_ACC=CAM_ASM_000771 /TAXON_ID=215587 /ORGANISM="Aplanochytrium stocchinoi, Strain GSBS06" /LENGTH=208 /DNA_ID=CAMNT_0051964535 /DNA_START=143 /DNA_END=770 /DNA_ORIENTATION=+